MARERAQNPAMATEQQTQIHTQDDAHNAFAAVYDAHVGQIYRYHYYRTRHRETAEDLTSQTFLKAFEHFGRFDAARASAATWLYRIARNTLIDHFRVSRPSTSIEETGETLSSGEDVARTAETNRTLEQVETILNRLTPDQREVVLLRLWDDLPYAEIAQLTDKSEAACKMTFSRALTEIRKHAGPAALLILLTLILN